MKAVRIHAFGGPEVVTYEEVPKPVPREQEVLFKVTSTCVNYADVQWRLGNYVDRTLPAILGREAAGIIEAVGPGVTTSQVGQPIMARAIGGNAEYAIAQSQNVFPCPAGLDMAQAGGIPIVFLTAYHLASSGATGALPRRPLRPSWSWPAAWGPMSRSTISPTTSRQKSCA